MSRRTRAAREKPGEAPAGGNDKGKGGVGKGDGSGACGRKTGTRRGVGLSRAEERRSSNELVRAAKTNEWQSEGTERRSRAGIPPRAEEAPGRAAFTIRLGTGLSGHGRGEESVAAAEEKEREGRRRFALRRPATSLHQPAGVSVGVKRRQRGHTKPRPSLGSAAKAQSR